MLRRLNQEASPICASSPAPIMLAFPQEQPCDDLAPVTSIGYADRRAFERSRTCKQCFVDLART